MTAPHSGTVLWSNGITYCAVPLATKQPLKLCPNLCFCRMLKFRMEEESWPLCV